MNSDFRGCFVFLTWCQIGLNFTGGGFDQDGFGRHVPVATFVARGHLFDRFQDIDPLGYLSEYAIAVPIARFRFVEEAVVLAIDEKLAASGVGLGQPGHCDCPLLVLQSIGGFVRDVAPSRLLLHVGGKTAPLDHEAGNYAMENGSIIKLFIDILEEIGDRNWGEFVLKFDNHIAHRSLQTHFGIAHKIFFQW